MFACPSCPDLVTWLGDGGRRRGGVLPRAKPNHSSFECGKFQVKLGKFARNYLAYFSLAFTATTDSKNHAIFSYGYKDWSWKKNKQTQTKLRLCYFILFLIGCNFNVDWWKECFPSIPKRNWGQPIEKNNHLKTSFTIFDFPTDENNIQSSLKLLFK